MESVPTLCTDRTRYLSRLPSSHGRVYCALCRDMAILIHVLVLPEIDLQFRVRQEPKNIYKLRDGGQWPVFNLSCMSVVIDLISEKGGREGRGGCRSSAEEAGRPRDAATTAGAVAAALRTVSCCKSPPPSSMKTTDCPDCGKAAAVHRSE
ncbi:hypothetical protein BD324DRAFT_260541 [Kockovaella imperatae]|uniref:Uncharacterized protein n=1 Tax=Kockovaella imperatae TaxID=4999 RepID=A0A1Y1UQ33_9TREE|nr:hypothetical protein BD324DRAFT_260541 [Kockovaella imperatae]ORX40133.1 hypothetical protein BD324DRAFT_260541 [Kockovaella imperatae]